MSDVNEPGDQKKRPAPSAFSFSQVGKRFKTQENVSTAATAGNLDDFDHDDKKLDAAAAEVHPKNTKTTVPKEEALAKARKRAQDRRQKKKAHCEELEREVLMLSRNNAFLRNENRELETVLVRARGGAAAREIQAEEEMRRNQQVQALGAAMNADPFLTDIPVLANATQFDTLSALGGHRDQRALLSNLLIHRLLERQRHVPREQAQGLVGHGVNPSRNDANAINVAPVGSNQDSALLLSMLARRLGRQTAPSVASGMPSMHNADLSASIQLLSQVQSPINQYLGNRIRSIENTYAASNPNNAGFDASSEIASLLLHRQSIRASLVDQIVNNESYTNRTNDIRSLLTQQILSDSNTTSATEPIAAAASYPNALNISPPALSAIIRSRANNPEQNQDDSQSSTTAQLISSLLRSSGPATLSSPQLRHQTEPTSAHNASALSTAVANMDLPSSAISVPRDKSPDCIENPQSYKAQLIAQLLRSSSTNASSPPSRQSGSSSSAA